MIDSGKLPGRPSAGIDDFYLLRWGNTLRVRLATAAMVAIGIMGCTATYHVNSLSGTGKVTLDPALGVYVAVPADGTYETKTYAGSGQSAATAVAIAFGKKAATLHVAASVQPLDSTMAAARALNVGYVVIPTVAHWEQRATEWSGKPSRMTIRLEILDAKTGHRACGGVDRRGEPDDDPNVHKP